MRYLYLFLLILSSVSGFSQRLNPETKSSESRCGLPFITVRCYRPLPNNQPPLYIVDGELVAAKLLSCFKAEDIESIDILKPETAQALWGSRGSAGVIIVKTKELSFRSFQATDAEDNVKLAGATFTFTAIDSSETIQLIADEEGMVISTAFPAGKKYVVQISSVGYKDFQTFYTRGEEKTTSHYRLSRDVKENAEVIVMSPIRCTLRRCYISCGVTGLTSVLLTDSVSNTAALPVAGLYPNPVVRGGVVKLEMKNVAEATFQIRVANIGGAALSTFVYKPTRGVNRIEIPVANQWAAGIYIVQVVSQQGKLLKQDKLIVQ